MKATKVFWVEPMDIVRVGLRRYRSGSVCAAKEHSRGPGYCDATTFIGNQPAIYAKRAGDTHAKCYLDLRPMVNHSDPRWPKVCEHCGIPFVDGDAWQMWQDQIYWNPTTKESYPKRELPPGACYSACWMEDIPAYSGADGRSMHVVLPDNTDWCIDARASNCTLPKDNEHKCWVRHGRPEDGTLLVDKNGKSCAAGAGSIQTDKWRGFLRIKDGWSYLVEA